MTKNLKNRIITSFFLLILLFLMLINNFILTYFLIVGGIFSLLEFFKIIKIIFKDKIIKQFANQNIILESIGDLWSIKII